MRIGSCWVHMSSICVLGNRRVKWQWRGSEEMWWPGCADKMCVFGGVETDTDKTVVCALKAGNIYLEQGLQTFWRLQL